MGCRCGGGQNIPVHAFLTSWIYGPDKCHRSRHLPKTIRSTDNLKHTMLEARRVKEERRRKHTRAGDSKPKPRKSWWNKHRLLNVFCSRVDSTGKSLIGIFCTSSGFDILCYEAPADQWLEKRGLLVARLRLREY